jgi:hypothetical protein
VKVFKPATVAGELCLWMYGIVISGGFCFGIAYLFEKALGCQLNEGGVGSCMLGPVDIVTPLTLLAMLGGVTLFFIGPVLFAIGTIAGLIAALRRKW